MIRPADHGQEDIKVLRVDWGRVRKCLEYHGTGRVRVGSGDFQIARVGPDYPDSPPDT